MQNLDQVLSIMEEYSFFAKESKCEFRLTEILYLGYVIGADGVKVHQEKIQEILDWPPQRNVLDLRGFMGLCSYYRRFARGFSQLATPLTDLTWKGAFKWKVEAEETFDRLKQVISTCPILALPDLSRPFVLEGDTSGSGIGAVCSCKIDI